MRNGMWPTSVYNLGIGVALCSTSLIGDWKIVRPVNQHLWAVGRILHLPSGNVYRTTDNGIFGYYNMQLQFL